MKYIVIPSKRVFSFSLLKVLVHRIKVNANYEHPYNIQMKYIVHTNFI